MMTIFKTMLTTSLKDKISLGYSSIFPIVLLLGLGFYINSSSYHPLLLTGVIAISTVFWGVQGIAFQVHSQRSKGVYKLLKMTPLSTISFVAIMTLARTLIGVTINIIVFFIGIIVFEIEVSFIGVLQIILLLTIGTLCFSGLGFLLSNIAKNEAQINMISNLVYLPMVFGSSAFYSLDNAPQWVVFVGKLFPFKYFVDSLRVALNIHSGNIWGGFIILMVFTVGFILTATFTFKWEADQSMINIKSKKNQYAV